MLSSDWSIHLMLSSDWSIMFQVTLYAYTGTWLADFPANHYTHFVGLLLQPNQEEVSCQLSESGDHISINISASDGPDDEGGAGGSRRLIYWLPVLSKSYQNLKLLVRPLSRLPGYCRRVRALSSPNIVDVINRINILASDPILYCLLYYYSVSITL